MSSHSTNTPRDEQLAWLVQDGLGLLGQPKSWRNLSSWQRDMLEQQFAFRRRATPRFPDPEGWLWTDRSLSQASDWWTACYKASLFPDGETVWDVCCGAGVDAVAIGRRGPVVAVDYDKEMIALARANGKLHGVAIDGRQQAFDADQISECRWLHIDPDRRPKQRKTLDADEFTPPLEDVLKAAMRVQGGVIKIAPSTRFSDSVLQTIECNSDRVWVGSRGECRQQLLLTGDLRAQAEGMHRAVLVGRDDSSDGIPVLFDGPPESYAECDEEPSSYVYDLHSVLHAADLQLAFGNANSMRPLGAEHGYFTSDLACVTPWAQCFRVIEVLQWDDRKVRKWLRSRGCGVVEVKTRLATVDANAYQRRYSQSSGTPMTLLVTRLSGRTRVIMAERQTNESR